MKLYKKQLRVIKQSFKKALHRELNKKGFSLISVMVASVIGLIVIYGLNKSLVHLNMQSQALEARMKQINLQTTVKNYFNSLDKCTNFFSCSHSFKTSPNSFRFSALTLLDASNNLQNSTVDFSNPNFVKSLNLKEGGYNLFEGRCPCVPSLTEPCEYHDCKILMYTQTGNNIKYHQIAEFRVEGKTAEPPDPPEIIAGCNTSYYPNPPVEESYHCI